MAKRLTIDDLAPKLDAMEAEYIELEKAESAARKIVYKASDAVHAIEDNMFKLEVKMDICRDKIYRLDFTNCATCGQPVKN